MLVWLVFCIYLLSNFLSLRYEIRNMSNISHVMCIIVLGCSHAPHPVRLCVAGCRTSVTSRRVASHRRSVTCRGQATAASYMECNKVQLQHIGQSPWRPTVLKTATRSVTGWCGQERRKGARDVKTLGSPVRRSQDLHENDIRKRELYIYILYTACCN